MTSSEKWSTTIVITSILMIIATFFFPMALVLEKNTSFQKNETITTTIKLETTTKLETTKVVSTKPETTTKLEIVSTKPEKTTTLETTKNSSTKPEKLATTKKTWKGKKLNRVNGAVKGPEGRETYYNLPMGGVIKIAKRELGMYEKYWVRDDGVKMYGKYVMCAADFSFRTRGTVVQTSLGEGMILDTGCAYGTIDIAVNWVV